MNLYKTLRELENYEKKLSSEVKNYQLSDEELQQIKIETDKSKNKRNKAYWEYFNQKANSSEISRLKMHHWNFKRTKK